jgi:PRTRC genetic system protein A
MSEETVVNQIPLPISGNILGTPLYIKDKPLDFKDTWPEDRMFYLLTSKGLMICRNTPFYRSCVQAPADKGPSELEEQSSFMRLRYPKIPQDMIETIVAFFYEVKKKHNSEAYVCLLWNNKTNAYELFCPEQTVTGGHVDYELPDLEPHLMVVGDIHSHVDMSAFSSGVDTDDETQRPGIHVVVGHISSEPPEFHCESVVDGNRFNVKISLVVEKYEKRSTSPAGWIDKVKHKTYQSGKNFTGYHSQNNEYGHGGYGGHHYD